MAISQSQSRPGLGEQFLSSAFQGAGQSLGRQGAEAVGGMVGSGASKLGKLAGLGGPSKQMVELIVAQTGMSPEQAAEFLEMDPRSQQQILANFGQQKQQEQAQQQQQQTQNQFAKEMGGVPQQGQQQAPEEEYDQELVKLASSGASDEELAEYIQKQRQQQEEEDVKVKPEYMLSPKKEYARLKSEGFSDAHANKQTDLHAKEYQEKQDKAQSWVKELLQTTNKEPHKQANLMKIVDITKEGKNPPATAAAIVKTLKDGIPGLPKPNLTSWLGSNAEQIDKLAADFIATAPTYGGKGMPQDLVKILLSSYPAIDQSDEAKLMNANAQLVQSKVNMLARDAFEQIKKEEKRKLPKGQKWEMPINIDELVEDRIAGKREKIYENWREGKSDIPGYKKALEQAREREGGSTLSSLLGGAIGGLGGLFTGAKIGGSIGGLPGAALGGLAGLAGTLGGAAAGSYAPRALKDVGELPGRALKSAQEGSRRIEDSLGIPDVSGGIRNLIGLGPRAR